MNRFSGVFFVGLLFNFIILTILYFGLLHFVIAFFILGIFSFLPNIWFTSYYGRKTSWFLKNSYQKTYNKYQETIKVKDVFLVSPKIKNERDLLNELSKSELKILFLYINFRKNIFPSFLLCVSSLFIYTFFMNGHL